jgi:VWFA-related protein
MKAFPIPRLNRIALLGLLAEIACFPLLGAWSAPSQEPSAPARSGISSIAPDSSTFLSSARKKDGAPAELSAADLEIKFDGSPVTVREVRRLGRVPLHYCILFDSSGGRRKFIELQREEAAEILSKVVQAGRDKGMAVAFSDKVYFDVDAEKDDPEKLANAFKEEIARGSTSLYNAVVSVADYLAKDEPEPGLRVIFLLSDGDDNSSQMTKDDAILALVKAGIRVYAIGQGLNSNPSPGETSRAAATMKDFARRTGGRSYSKVEQKDVTRIVADIADELANVFSVTYRSPVQKQDGRLHKLEVKSRKKDISISAPDRYFATH